MKLKNQPALMACIIFILHIHAPVFSQFSDRKPLHQEPVTDTAEIIKRAEMNYTHGNYKFALPLYLKLYPANSGSVLVNYRIGICYLNTTNKSKAIDYLEKAKQIDQNKIHRDLDFFLGQAYHAHHEFDNAIAHYRKYQSTLDTKHHEFDMELGQEISRLVEQCFTGKRLMEDPVKVSVEHLNAKVNSPYSEKKPLISLDGNHLYFSSGRPSTTGLQIDPVSGQYFNDIYYSRKTANNWSAARQLQGGVNTNGNDFPLSLTSDGKRMYVSSTKNERGSIYYSDKKDSLWTSPVAMDKQINQINHETGASITYDGRTFYFSSDMEGGYGGNDLYKCELRADNTWGPPLNLGQAINSQFDEDDPFILKDGKTLYFSSQGHTTMGGYDIFVSKYDERLLDWEVPENLGYPINSSEDEISISWTGDGKNGYYSEENEEGFGNEDIYRISFESIVKKDVSLPAPKDKKELPKALVKNAVETSYLPQPKAGDILTEQVHFAFNEYHTITEYSKSKIASVIKLLNAYSNLVIEIEGFTDNTDNHDYNLNISKGRAEAVYAYMLGKGVDKGRIQVKLYNENQPNTINTTNPETNIRNRRVAFKVLK